MPRVGRRIVGSLVAERLFTGVTALFALAVLIQIFLAGEAALVAPEVWQLHVAWVHAFQWLSIALPITAYLARGKLGFAVLNCVPMAVIGLQYVFIHRAISNAMPMLAGLHAVNAVLLLGFSVWILRASIAPTGV